jgi:hypothetical protein
MDVTLDSVSAWFRRAENFVRGLNRLPGQWGISISVEPPVEISRDDDADTALPAPLLRLYTEGSARFSCQYHWKPDSTDLSRLSELFPHQYSFYGGAEFIPWDDLPREPGVDWGWFDEDHHTAEEKLADDIWKRTFPFIHVGNGDMVGLLITDGSDSMPVVYLSHEEPAEVTFLSESLERFLVDWEQLGYIGPEIWLLGQFLDEGPEGLPRMDPEKVNQWREILSCGAP